MFFKVCEERKCERASVARLIVQLLSKLALMVVYRGKCTHHLLKRSPEGSWLVNNKVRVDGTDEMTEKKMEMKAAAVGRYLLIKKSNCFCGVFASLSRYRRALRLKPRRWKVY